MPTTREYTVCKENCARYSLNNFVKFAKFKNNYYNYKNMKLFFKISMLTPIWLKPGTIMGHLKAIVTSKFGVYARKIHRALIDFFGKSRTIFSHAYNVNH